jgi:hypothetical protein
VKKVAQNVAQTIFGQKLYMTSTVKNSQNLGYFCNLVKKLRKVNDCPKWAKICPIRSPCLPSTDERALATEKSHFYLKKKFAGAQWSLVTKMRNRCRPQTGLPDGIFSNKKSQFS